MPAPVVLSLTARHRLQPGVLVLAPEVGESSWTVLEVDAETFESIRLPVGVEDATLGAEQFSGLGLALAAAYDVLTIITEGRCPPMDEHIQQTMREFLEALEGKGYDREVAVNLLLDMVDRATIRPPKAQNSSDRLQENAPALP